LEDGDELLQIRIVKTLGCRVFGHTEWRYGD